MSIPTNPGTVSKIEHYWKIVIFVAGAVVAVGTQVVDTIVTNSADGSFSTSDWISAAVLLVTGFGVYFKKNIPLPDKWQRKTTLPTGQSTDSVW